MIIGTCRQRLHLLSHYFNGPSIKSVSSKYYEHELRASFAVAITTMCINRKIGTAALGDYGAYLKTHFKICLLIVLRQRSRHEVDIA